MKKLSLKVAPSLALLALLVACGKSGSEQKGPDSNIVTETISPDGSNIDGTYRATFTTLNSHVNGTIPGSVTFLRKEDRIMVFLRLFAGGPQTWHQQYIYNGRCPTMGDDANADGYVDIMEAEAVLGSIIIPLDSDISSQSSGSRFFPLSDPSGSYHYERVTSFSRFFRDLKSEDKNHEDNIIKLAENEGLGLEGKPVLIQGVNKDIVFPETVAGKGRYKAFQTLPIVCGVFSKVTTLPGTPYDGQIPGPIAEVDENGDVPAPDGTGEVPGSTGGGTSSGTNTPETTGNTSDGESGGTDGGSTIGGETTSGSTGGTTSGSTTGGTTGSDDEEDDDDNETTGWTSGGWTGWTSGGWTGWTSGGSNGSTGGSSGGTTGGTTGDDSEE